jgi:hypothetical protein
MNKDETIHKYDTDEENIHDHLGMNFILKQLFFYQILSKILMEDIFFIHRICIKYSKS